jgi:uncharacterized membrane protein
MTHGTPMALVGKLHPLVVHFPIGLVLAAAAAEIAAIAAPARSWRTIAVANLRAGAVMGIVTAITGWLLASSPLADPALPVAWHRWVGMAAAVAALGAALVSFRLRAESHRSTVAYRAALFGAALLVAITGHLGGMLVWGAGFFRL